MKSVGRNTLVMFTNFSTVFLGTTFLGLFLAQVVGLRALGYVVAFSVSISIYSLILDYYMRHVYNWNSLVTEELEKDKRELLELKSLDDVDRAEFAENYISLSKKISEEKQR